MDGWATRELTMFSKKACEKIATMLNMVEAGAGWPKSALHARIVYLEKLGAAVGKVMSYRPLTVSAPIYRAWAALRLADLSGWIEQWAVDEMYAGVPGKGAVDA